jgi:MATE family multidrug resistance protein
MSAWWPRPKIRDGQEISQRVKARPNMPKSGLRAQWRPTIHLALPVILAEIGWMAMAIVDTFMVGGLGPVAIGAVSVGGMLHFAVVIFGMGLLLGLDTIVSHAFGANKSAEGQRSLIQALWLSLLLTLPMVAIQFLLADHLGDLGITPEVVTLATPYMKSLAWGTLPLLVQGAFRRYLQALGVVRPALVAVLTANVVNWFGNWLLIRGHLGFPALGVDGSGWSTTVSRIYLAGVMIAAAVLRERAFTLPFWRVPRGLDPRRMLALLKLGLPAAIQITLEVGVFAVATTLAGRLSTESLAAHQIVLNLSSLTFMVPLGISSAGSVRVGHAIGRRDRRGAISAGWAAIGLGVGVMAVFGVVLLSFPRGITSIFTDDPVVLAIATRLLVVVACYQLFDGLQVVTTGVLRGAGDTRTAMVTGLVAHWGIGLPIAAWLGLGRGQGVVGLWIGLSIGLCLAGAVLLVAWLRKVRRLRDDPATDREEHSPS